MSLFCVFSFYFACFPCFFFLYFACFCFLLFVCCLFFICVLFGFGFGFGFGFLSLSFSFFLLFFVFFLFVVFLCYFFAVGSRANQTWSIPSTRLENSTETFSSFGHMSLQNKRRPPGTTMITMTGTGTGAKPTSVWWEVAISLQTIVRYNAVTASSVTSLEVLHAHPSCKPHGDAFPRVYPKPERNLLALNPGSMRTLLAALPGQSRGSSLTSDHSPTNRGNTVISYRLGWDDRVIIHPIKRSSAPVEPAALVWARETKHCTSSSSRGYFTTPCVFLLY